MEQHACLTQAIKSVSAQDIKQLPSICHAKAGQALKPLAECLHAVAYASALQDAAAIHAKFDRHSLLLLQLGWMETGAALLVLVRKACACRTSANSICWWQWIRLSLERISTQLGNRCSWRQAESNPIHEC